MNQERLLKVLLSGHFSEKATRLAELAKRQIVFKVVADATKLEIKTAVEKLFDVKVQQVHVCRVKGKATSRMGQVVGRRKDWKKAYVSLQEGYDIDFGGGE